MFLKFFTDIVKRATNLPRGVGVPVILEVLSDPGVYGGERHLVIVVPHGDTDQSTIRVRGFLLPVRPVLLLVICEVLLTLGYGLVEFLQPRGLRRLRLRIGRHGRYGELGQRHYVGYVLEPRQIRQVRLLVIVDALVFAGVRCASRRLLRESLLVHVFDLDGVRGLRDRVVESQVAAAIDPLAAEVERGVRHLAGRRR